MPKCSLKSFLFILAVAAFGLNLLWEIAQVFAFSSLSKASTFEVAILVTVASAADALITLVAYLIVAWLRRGWSWWESAGASDFVIFAIAGAVSATLIEMVAVSRGVWAYGSYMPIVPLLEVGLLPLLQLIFLLPAALGVSLWWCRR